MPDIRTIRVFIFFTTILHPSLCSYLWPRWGPFPSVQLLPPQLPSAGCLDGCSKRWKAVWTLPGSGAAAVSSSSLAQTSPSGTVPYPTIHHSCSAPPWTGRSYWPPWRKAEGRSDCFTGSPALTICVWKDWRMRQHWLLLPFFGNWTCRSHYDKETCSSFIHKYMNNVNTHENKRTRDRTSESNKYWNKITQQTLNKPVYGM